MALSNQNDLPAFFSHRKVNLNFGLIQKGDLPRMAKSRKITYQEWPNSKYDLPSLATFPAYNKLESQKRI